MKSGGIVINHSNMRCSEGGGFGGTAGSPIINLSNNPLIKTPVNNATQITKYFRF